MGYRRLGVLALLFVALGMGMTTDPLITAWYADSKDKYVNGQEVADVCIYDFGIPLRPDGANLVFANGNEFMAQELFDPITNTCAPTL